MITVIFFILVSGTASFLRGPNKRRGLGYCKKDTEFEITLQPPKDLEVELGDTVSVVCAAHGHGSSDPLVYWVKSVGPDFGEEGKPLGPVAIGKSILYFDSVAKDDIDTYKCVIESCFQGPKETRAFGMDLHVRDTPCEDVYGIGNVVYSTVFHYKTFADARKYCSVLGMDLALPRNADENKELLGDVKTYFKQHPNANKYKNENWLWIGASDVEKEGTFVDVKSGKEITYSNFQGQQPDNWSMNDKYPEGQDYAGFNRGKGNWDDSFSHYKRPFVCHCPKK